MTCRCELLRPCAGQPAAPCTHPATRDACAPRTQTQGIKLLNDAIEVMTTEIRKAKGELQVKVAARAVDERDDKALSQLMSTLDAQNQEVDGDADEEDVEGMGNVNLEGV